MSEKKESIGAWKKTTKDGKEVINFTINGQRYNMWVKSKAREWSRLKNAFDRINASSVHQIDAIRSILSWEKAKINL